MQVVEAAVFNFNAISKKPLTKTMDVQLINSTTSTDASEEVQEWTITNEYILFAINHLMLLIEVAGFVGVVLVFMVARYLVTVEKKIGKKNPFS